MQSGGKLSVRAHHPDYVIALVVAILLAIGLILMYSISPILSHKLTGTTDRNYFFLNQIVYVAIGIGFWIVATAIPYTRYRKWATYLIVGAGIALLALFVPGLARSANGAARWLKIGPVSVQPA